MKLNLVLHFGIGCLMNVLLPDYVNAAPVAKPILEDIKTKETPYDHVQDTEDSQAIRMFPQRVKSASSEKMHEHEKWQTTDTLEILPSVQEKTTSDLKIPTRAKKEGKPAATELTIKVPNYKTDHMGNWVFNPWGITYGKVWQDTRFNIHKPVTIPRMRLDSKPFQNYYPYNKQLSSVCVGKSTIYNSPKVKNWLHPHIYDFVHGYRTFYHPLRRKLFANGFPEECHTKDHIKFREFQECNAQRNQRMEYLIPSYPSHQSKPSRPYKP